MPILEGLRGEWKLEALLSHERRCNYSCGSGRFLARAKRRAESSRAGPGRGSRRPLGSRPGGERVTPTALGKGRTLASESGGFNCGKRARCPLFSLFSLRLFLVHFKCLHISLVEISAIIYSTFRDAFTQALNGNVVNTARSQCSY